MWNERRDEDQPKRPFPLRKLAVTMLVMSVLTIFVAGYLEVSRDLMGWAGIVFIVALLVLFVGPKEVERNEKGR